MEIFLFLLRRFFLSSGLSFLEFLELLSVAPSLSEMPLFLALLWDGRRTGPVLAPGVA